jgi:hypothetical protein
MSNTKRRPWQNYSVTWHMLWDLADHWDDSPAGFDGQATWVLEQILRGCERKAGFDLFDQAERERLRGAAAEIAALAGTTVPELLEWLDRCRKEATPCGPAGQPW